MVSLILFSQSNRNRTKEISFSFTCPLKNIGNGNIKSQIFVRAWKIETTVRFRKRGQNRSL